MLGVTLVIPRSIHVTYADSQRASLMTLSDLVQELRQLQADA